MIDADIRIEYDRWDEEGLDLEAVVEQALAAAMTEMDDAPVASEVVVFFTDDGAQKLLNAKYRGKDAPTNVLSFPTTIMPLPTGMLTPLGDISLAYQTVAREAQEAGLPFPAHLQHLIIHGFLHLLGYDHENDTEASLMETTETRALARLGIADPYSAQQV